LQYAELRDPYKYWDQQNRRDFGEIMYDHANTVGIMTPGPLDDGYTHYMHVLKFAAVVVGVYALFEVLEIDKKRTTMASTSL